MRHPFIGHHTKDFPYLLKVTGATFDRVSILVLHLEWYKKLLAPSSKMVCEDSLLCSAFPFHGKVYFIGRQREGPVVVDSEAALPKLTLTIRCPSVVFKLVQNFWF